jgi:GAF domain-containing protein
MNEGVFGPSQVASQLATVVGVFMAAVLEILQPEFADVQLVTDGDTLSLVAHRGLQPYFLHSFRRLARHAGTVCTRAFDGRTTVTIRDVHNDPIYAPYTDIAKAVGYNAVTSIPLITTSGKCVGVASALFALSGEPVAEQMAAMVPFCLGVADEIDRLLDGTSATVEADALFQRLVDQAAISSAANIDTLERTRVRTSQA